ncbi:winged helix-turn-helix domain-containing protein [Salmonirosea aquatica]|uniref:Transcriptional regulator n=1 Tax=Salmonirosea aquatica TaxID=2654236 RepID=A0A7C9FDP7_9BACT|nr:transcriptional regulator [Cytophagaceae bacterium SJW1-29]
MKKVGVGMVLLLVGLLFTQFARSVSAEKETYGTGFARKANLALRRTAHTLLRQQGDSTSRIAPVQQINDRTFSIRLEQSFAYDGIPTLLQESLELYKIGTPYDVAVLDCTNGEVQLGYTFYDLKSPEGVACSGRVQDKGCHTLQVTFSAPPAATPVAASNWWAGALGFLLAGLMGLVWYRVARARVPVEVREAESTQDSDLKLGQTHFFVTDQSLTVAGKRHNLTYREAKLLRLFAMHPNQLLEREFILKSVWEDEGIIVGRSVDVFVSRLRKLLHNDPTLRIASVHGVGYRLEVHSKIT